MSGRIPEEKKAAPQKEKVLLAEAKIAPEEEKSELEHICLRYSFNESLKKVSATKPKTRKKGRKKQNKGIANWEVNGKTYCINKRKIKQHAIELTCAAAAAGQLAFLQRLKLENLLYTGVDTHGLHPWLYALIMQHQKTVQFFQSLDTFNRNDKELALVEQFLETLKDKATHPFLPAEAQDNALSLDIILAKMSNKKGQPAADKHQALRRAAAKGHIEYVRYLIEEEAAHPNCVGLPSKVSALYHATLYAHHQVVLYLCQKGAILSEFEIRKLQEHFSKNQSKQPQTQYKKHTYPKKGAALVIQCNPEHENFTQALSKLDNVIQAFRSQDRALSKADIDLYTMMNAFIFNKNTITKFKQSLDEALKIYARFTDRDKQKLSKDFLSLLIENHHYWIAYLCSLESQQTITNQARIDYLTTYYGLIALYDTSNDRNAQKESVSTILTALHEYNLFLADHQKTIHVSFVYGWSLLSRRFERSLNFSNLYLTQSCAPPVSQFLSKEYLELKVTLFCQTFIQDLVPSAATCDEKENSELEALPLFANPSSRTTAFNEGLAQLHIKTNIQKPFVWASILKNMSTKVTLRNKSVLLNQASIDSILSAFRDTVRACKTVNELSYVLFQTSKLPIMLDEDTVNYFFSQLDRLNQGIKNACYTELNTLTHLIRGLGNLVRRNSLTELNIKRLMHYTLLLCVKNDLETNSVEKSLQHTYMLAFVSAGIPDNSGYQDELCALFVTHLSATKHFLEKRGAALSNQQNYMLHLAMTFFKNHRSDDADKSLYMHKDPWVNNIHAMAKHSRKEVSSSVSHQAISQVLNDMGYRVQNEVDYNGLPVDIEITSASNQKIVIQVDGPQHYAHSIEGDDCLRNRDIIHDIIIGSKKGVSIVHIKTQDWHALKNAPLSDKQAFLNRVLEPFLPEQAHNQVAEDDLALEEKVAYSNEVPQAPDGPKQRMRFD